MTEQERKFDSEHDPEATVISPRFDDEATVIAQPVVPLDDKAVTEDLGTYVNTGTAPPVVERAWKRRRQLTVALVLIALILGTVAGVVGLRLYQSNRAADRPAASNEQTQSAAESSQPPNETTNQVSAETSPPQETVAAAVADGEAKAEKTAERVKEEKETKVENAASRKSSSEAERVAAVKHGKQGEGEPDKRGDEVRPRVYDTQGEMPDNPEAERRARREEQRLRRAEQTLRRERRGARRERRARMVDSIRGIFEGNNESPPR